MNGFTHSPLNRPKPAILSILLCLTPDNFTRQWGTPRSQSVNRQMYEFGNSIPWRCNFNPFIPRAAPIDK